MHLFPASSLLSLSIFLLHRQTHTDQQFPTRLLPLRSHHAVAQTRPRAPKKEEQNKKTRITHSNSSSTYIFTTLNVKYIFTSCCMYDVAYECGGGRGKKGSARRAGKDRPWPPPTTFSCRIGTYRWPAEFGLQALKLDVDLGRLCGGLSASFLGPPISPTVGGCWGRERRRRRSGEVD